MKLEYILQQLVVGIEKKYYGQPEYRDSWDKEQVIEEMMQRNSGLSRQMIEGVLSLLEQVITTKLQQGYRINLDWINLALVIKGTFDEGERFDPEKHKVKLQATEGKGLAKILKYFVPARLTKKGSRGPLLGTFTDLKTNSREVITPGGIGRLTGDRLKLDLDDQQQGLWLVAQDKSKLPISLFVENYPKKLTFYLPADLPAGDYRFELKNKIYQRGKYQTGLMAQVLTVINTGDAPLS